MCGNRELGPLQYFTAECFEESAALASQFGISYKRSRRLVRGAVSTIFLSTAAVAIAEVADYASAPSSSSRKRPAAAESSFRKRTAAELPETATTKRSAVEKRERARVWQTLIIKRNKNHSYNIIQVINKRKKHFCDTLVITIYIYILFLMVV